MNADGTHPHRLTYNNVMDGYPSWSPDGRHLVFTSDRSGDWGLHIIALASQRVTQLTGIEGEEPSAAGDWSPGGTEITFERVITVVSSRETEGQSPFFLIDSKLDTNA